MRGLHPLPPVQELLAAERQAADDLKRDSGGVEDIAPVVSGDQDLVLEVWTKQIWHIYDSQGQVLALVFRQRSLSSTFKPPKTQRIKPRVLRMKGLIRGPNSIGHIASVLSRDQHLVLEV